MRAREREPTKKQIFKTMGEGIGEGGGGRTNNNANIIIIEITAKFIESRSLQVLNELKKMPSWLDFVSALRKSRVNSVQIDKIPKYNNY